ncbi:threonyl-tRNA synthetase [Marasmius crinis-equi]|uniref:Threonyl-tRNA synthetase n=1 Tax=Marasmius crinis-equi TaxID=585013 RepID=A0ABR3FG56_9AGAR
MAAPAPAAKPAQQGGQKEKGQKKGKAVAASDFPLELQPPPEFFSHRIELFEQLKAEYDEQVKSKPREEITITLPDGNEKKGKSWETSPMDVAKEISKGLSEKVVIAKVNGEVWDLDRPLEGSCSLELLDFEHPEGMQAISDIKYPI